MKSVTMNAMLATAAWMVASTAASAAELKFDVPFAFQAGNKVMAPGKYVVRASNDEVHFQIKNSQSADSVFLLSQGSDNPRKEWEALIGGVLQFECVEDRCTLRQVWTHDGFPAQVLPGPKPHKGQSTRVAFVRSAVERTK
jgi:hypothetical protein